MSAQAEAPRSRAHSRAARMGAVADVHAVEEPGGEHDAPGSAHDVLWPLDDPHGWLPAHGAGHGAAGVAVQLAALDRLALVHDVLAAADAELALDAPALEVE